MLIDLGILNLNIKEALEGKIKPVSSKVLDNLENNIRNNLKEYIKNPNKITKNYSEYTINNYSELKDKALKGIDINKITEKDISEELKDSLMLEVPNFNNKLSNLVPQNLAETLFGLDERDPSDFEKSKFVRSMRVVENPNHVLELLNSGQLSGLEIEVLANFYPNYYEWLKTILLEIMAELKGKEQKEVNNYLLNKNLSMLLQVGRVTPEVLKQASTAPVKASVNLPESQPSELTRLTS